MKFIKNSILSLVTFILFQFTLTEKIISENTPYPLYPPKRVSGIDSNIVDIVHVNVNSTTNVVILTEWSSIFKSDDEGKTWIKINNMFREKNGEKVLIILILDWIR